MKKGKNNTLSRIFILIICLLFGIFVLNKPEPGNVAIFGLSRNRLIISLLMFLMLIMNIGITLNPTKNFIVNKLTILTKKHKFYLPFLIIIINVSLIIIFIFFSKIDSIPKYLFDEYIIFGAAIFVSIFNFIYIFFNFGIEIGIFHNASFNSKQAWLKILHIQTKVLVCGISATMAAAVIYVTIMRIDYPFVLEWMEGGSLIQVNRILKGLPLYAEPSTDYVPFIYPPFYFYISSIFVRIFGLSLFPLRLVSVLSTSLICFLLYLITKKETGNRTFSLLSIGFFFMIYKISGAWFDIARVDMLFLAFLLAGFYVLFYDEKVSKMWGGVFFALTILTKQTSVISVSILSLYFILTNIKKKKDLLHFFVGLLVTSSGFYIFEYSSSGRWLNYYLFELPKNHQIDFIHSFVYVNQKLFEPIVGFTLISLLALLKKITNFHLLILFISLWSYSLISILNPGGWLNVNIPLYVGAALLSSININNICEFMSRIPRYQNSFLLIGIMVLFVYQASICFFNPFEQIPTKADIEVGKNLMNRVSKMDGPIFASSASYLSILNGAEGSPHWIAVQEILDEFGTGKSRDNSLIKQFQKMIDQGEYSMLVMDYSPSYYGLLIDEQFYKLNRIDERAFNPVTGGLVRPVFIYQRR